MFCECKQDGWCPKYTRELGGRMREICAGVNIDLGTAAAFREQWAREADAKAFNGTPTPLLLKTNQAPGDAVAMTAAIYSLHRAYPGRYTTAVESLWPEVFAHNPDVVAQVSGEAEVHMHYPAIHQSNQRGIHFMQGWCEFLGMSLGIPLPLMTNRPRLYFDKPNPTVDDYWVVCSGGKNDFTNKLWGHDRYQNVLDILRHDVKFIQVGGAGHDHQHLRKAISVVGNTTLRELFELVRQSRGVLCGVSLLMHVAAALDKPCVVVAGGREPVAWNVYPKQHYLHTVGLLPCYTSQGDTGGACWRSRVVPLGDNQLLDKDTCLYPVNDLPKCMRLITPEYVAETIMQVERGLCQRC